MIELHITCLVFLLDRKIIGYRPGYRRLPAMSGMDALHQKKVPTSLLDY